jgi:prolyl-tRNA synthetase
MRLSHSFVRPLRQAPKDADTVNHRLLTQAGYVEQLMAGVYTYLPLGKRVLDRISQVVREEMDAIGGEEILMPLLHPSNIWKQSGGWEDVDVLFKVPSRTDRQYALAQSEEEVVSPLFLKRLQSFGNLGVSRPYNVQWKFRDELRAKSGIMRGREFLMKDMYSFHTTQEDFDEFYEQAKQAYVKTFERLGLTAKVTEASGGNFTDKVSYEFMVLTDAGEDDILYSEESDYCINTEIAEDDQQGPNGEALKKATASEVGNVFDLGTKYTKAFDLKAPGPDGKPMHPIMGCYGIGISRVMGVIVEHHHDDAGIVWPEEVAPFQVHLVSLAQDDQTRQTADTLYDDLRNAGVDVLYDDRDERAGVKFADADLLGMPQRVTISAKTLAEQSFELKGRSESDSKLHPLSKAVELLGKKR